MLKTILVTTLTVILTIGVIIVWISLFVIFKKGWGKVIKSKRMPLETVDAKIKQKRGISEYNIYTRTNEIATRNIFFECSDGTEKIFEVPDEVFDDCSEGDEGVLEYQGSLFRHFTAKHRSESAEDMMKRMSR